MKIIRCSLFARTLAVACLSATFAHGQAVVTQVIAGQGQDFSQTSTANPVLSSPGFFFTANVKGTDLSGITAPVITLANPGNVNTNYSFSNPAGHNGGVYGYAGDDTWNYGAPGFDGDIMFSTGPLRNTAFPFGAITIVVQGTTINLNTSGVGQPGLTTPKVTLTGGTWSGGTYLIDVNQTLTVTTNAFTQFSSGGPDATHFVDSLMTSELTDGSDNIIGGSRHFHSDDATNTISFTINPGTLTAGQTYFGFMENVGIVNMSTELAGSINAAFVSAGTNFTITAIPEPSTYAALAGAAAFGLAAWRRRRTRQAPAAIVT